MRWSIVLTLTVAGLGACLGAALTTTGQATGNGAATDANITRQKPAIDQQRTLDLEPVSAPPDVGEQAFAYARRLVAFGPRYSQPDGAATPGWSQQLEMIVATLAEHDIEATRDTWTDRRELITFTNIVAVLPGRRDERIVLGCHHDTKCTRGHPDAEHNFHFVGANDGASAVGLLLALAPVLQAQERQATIELVFFDGEESQDWNWNDAARALFGSKRYVQRHRDALLLGEEPRIEAMVLLDMVGRTDLHIQEELYSTELLRRICWSAAVAHGYQQNFFRRAEAAADDHKPFLDVGIPAIDLIDLNGNPYWHTKDDVLANISAASMQKVADVVLTMLPAIEKAFVTDRR